MGFYYTKRGKLLKFSSGMLEEISEVSLSLLVNIDGIRLPIDGNDSCTITQKLHASIDAKILAARSLSFDQ